MTEFHDFWGLKENPFLNNLDQRFLYPSTDFNESLARLLFNVLQIRGGLSLISGEIGSGKTTLSRALFQRLTDEGYPVALIANPRLSPTQLLRYIALELGVEKPGRTKLQVIDKINNLLIEQYREGKSAILLIDEAQLLTKACLEEVRLLTNLETDTEKLLQIVLFGQPELTKKVNRLRQFKQRINIRYHIGALSREEMDEYIQHRLEIAGNSKRNFFTEPALAAIYTYTEGIPRLINTVCLNAMLGGMIKQVESIGPELINDVINELEGTVE